MFIAKTQARVIFPAQIRSGYCGAALSDGLKMNRALKRGGWQKWQQSETRGMGIHLTVSAIFHTFQYR